MKSKYVIAIGVVIVLLLLISTAALASSLDKLVNQGAMDTPMVETLQVATTPQPVATTDTGLMVTTSGADAIANNPCPMMGSMSGSGTGMGGMTGTAMNGMSGMGSMPGTGMNGMSGTGMNGMSGVTGMGMVNVTSAQANGIPTWLTNPWLMLGWILLGVVVLAILFGIGLGIFWMVRRVKLAVPADHA